MHFQKLYVVVCLGAILGTSSLTLKADDTDAQARAREALRKAMEDLKTKGGAKPAAPAPQPAAPSAPVKEIPAPPPITPAPAPVAPTPTPVVTPAPVEPTPAPNFNTGQLTPEQQQQVLDAMRQEKSKLDASDRASGRSAENSDQAEMKKKEREAKAADAKIIATKNGNYVPPAPTDFAPGSKEQRLYDLLQLYKADKITPAEYHQQRAKILAE